MPGNHADILIRIRNGTTGDYAVEAWLSDGSFYIGLMSLPQETLTRLLALDASLDEYGQTLAAALFRPPIDEAFAVAAALARDSDERRLRVRLLLDREVPLKLHALKWERLSHVRGVRDDPLATTADTPFSRYTTLAMPEPEPLDEPTVHLLFVVSAPQDIASYHLAEINVEEEVENFFEALDDIWPSRRVRATILPGRSGVSPELRRRLMRAGCAVLDGPATLDNITKRLPDQHVFHYLGHGAFLDGQAYLYLEDDAGNAQPVPDTELVPRLTRPDLRLIFLAACESAKRDVVPGAETGDEISPFVGLGPKLVQNGVPAVVAMQEKVGLEEARMLAGAFYRRLFLAHGTVDLALNEARNLLRREDRPDWAIPVLFMRLKTGQLAATNPIWTALQAMARHKAFRAYTGVPERPSPGSDQPRRGYRTGEYVPLPLQAVAINASQDPSALQRQDPQPMGTVDLRRAVMDQLDARPAATARRGGRAPVVIVLGGPGSSKSSQLKRLAARTLENSLQNPGRQWLLPVYLDLQQADLSGSSFVNPLEAEVLTYLKLFWPDLEASTLDDLKDKARLRMFLSAGDRPAEEEGEGLLERALDLASSYPEHQYVIAMRPDAVAWDHLGALDGRDRLDLKILAIQPLTQRNIRHFLETQGEVGERLLDALHARQLFDLASTPYFLARMVWQANDGHYPTSRSRLLDDIVQDAIHAVPAAQGMRGDVLQILYRLAWEAQTSGKDAWSIGDTFRIITDVRGDRGYNPETVYSALVEEGILIGVGEDHVRFAYPPVQAYCCARAILEMPDWQQVTGDILAAVATPARLGRWEETLVCLCGLATGGPDFEPMLIVQRLLEPLVYGADLLEGEQLFLAARCLLECRVCTDAAAGAAVEELTQHVISALRWRSGLAEPNLRRRVVAIQLLSQLALPKVAIHLAQLAYDKVRQNQSGEWDYEFSTVRYAAAIALKRLEPGARDESLAQINPALPGLFCAWQDKQLDALVGFCSGDNDLGLRGIAALALGDLYGSFEKVEPVAARRAFAQLKTMFLSPDTPQSLRWAVADALSLVDVDEVADEIIEPAVGRDDQPGAPDPRLLASNDFKKSLAYLIGLLRVVQSDVDEFILKECLRVPEDGTSAVWSVWATAIVALGRIARKADRPLLAEIAAGTYQGADLATIFPEPGQRYFVRREALHALAEMGDLKTLATVRQSGVSDDPELTRAYYQAAYETYWRRGT